MATGTPQRCSSYLPNVSPYPHRKQNTCQVLKLTLVIAKRLALELKRVFVLSSHHLLHGMVTMLTRICVK